MISMSSYNSNLDKISNNNYFIHSVKGKKTKRMLAPAIKIPITTFFKNKVIEIQNRILQASPTKAVYKKEKEKKKNDKN